MNIQQFQPFINLVQTLILQYDQAVNLGGLVAAKQQWYDVNNGIFWQNWYDNVFNLQTANDFGLTVWAILLNLPIQAAPLTPDGKPIWGFGPADNLNENFTHGNFALDLPYGNLSTEEKRLILKLRYFQATNRCEAPTINKFLAFLAPSVSPTGTIYVIDNGDMTITYFFTFYIRPRVLAILLQFDILPRPAGVQVLTNVST